MISKKAKFSKNFRARILYELAARHCDKEKIKHVEFIGGNIVSGNPYYEYHEGGERKVFIDPEQIITEFEQHAAQYKGDSDNLCGHYILSLAKGEKLSSAEWLSSVHSYMKSLGYDDSTKYVAVIHRDTELEHVHIVASRVRVAARDATSSRAALGANFQLVEDSNDRHKGMNAAREIEHRYRLSTPRTDGWTKEIPRFSDPKKDYAYIMRGISKAIFKAPNRPRTMSQLVDRFAERGISIQVKHNNGKIFGISYKLTNKNVKFISGTDVMSTMLTWDALQRNGVSYSPHRDNLKLGLGLGIAQPDLASTAKFDATFRAYIKITKPKSSLNKYVRERSNKYDFFGDRTNYHLGFNIGIKLPQRKLKRQEVQHEIEKQRLDKIIRDIMKMVESILQAIFSIFEVTIDYESEIHDLSDVALKINVPMQDDFLDKSVDGKLKSQCISQLKFVIAQCLNNERSTLNEPKLVN